MSLYLPLPLLLLNYLLPPLLLLSYSLVVIFFLGRLFWTGWLGLPGLPLTRAFAATGVRFPISGGKGDRGSNGISCNGA